MRPKGFERKALTEVPSELLHFDYISLPKHLNRKKKAQDFPGGPVVENPPGSVGGMDSVPGLGRFFPHPKEQQSPLIATPEALEPVLCSKRSHHREKPASRE